MKEAFAEDRTPGRHQPEALRPAAALGVKAIKNGFSVTHFLLDNLMHAFKQDAAIPPARLRAKRYLNSALLITDEGRLPTPRSPRGQPPVPAVSARYERGSIVLTSNKHVQDWPEIFAGDEILGRSRHCTVSLTG